MVGHLLRGLPILREEYIGSQNFEQAKERALAIRKETLVSGRISSHPKSTLDFEQLDCSKLAELAGDGACRVVLETVCTRAREGLESTVWEIHQSTGLPLHESFAALRTLEYGKVIEIRDNPSDPFGATICLLVDGIEAMTKRNVA